MKIAYPARKRVERHNLHTPELIGTGDFLPLCQFQQIGLSPKTIANLNRAGIQTIADLKDRSPADLLKIPNLGRKSADAIVEALRLKGIELSPHPKDVTEESQWPIKYKYAEEWLDRAIGLMRPMFADAGYPIPAVRASVGFGTRGHDLNLVTRYMGECHPRRWSEEGLNDIYITPLVSGSVNVLVWLAHELMHAADDCENRHSSREFRAIAKAIGHPDYKKGHSSYGRPFRQKMLGFVEILGRYPRGGVKYMHRFPL